MTVHALRLAMGLALALALALAQHFQNADAKGCTVI